VSDSNLNKSGFNELERRAVSALASVYGLRMFGLFLILPVLAIYAEDLKGATPMLMGIALGVYGISQALFQIPFGILSDRFGRKPVILAGLSIFIIGSLVAAFGIEYRRRYSRKSITGSRCDRGGCTGSDQ